MIVAPDDMLAAFQLYAFKRGLRLTLMQVKAARAIFFMLACHCDLQEFFFKPATGKTTLFDLLEHFSQVACEHGMELCGQDERPFDPRDIAPLRILYPIWNGARIEGMFEERQTVQVESALTGTLTGPCGFCGKTVELTITPSSGDIELICNHCRTLREAGLEMGQPTVRIEPHEPCASVLCPLCNPPRVIAKGEA